MNRCLRSAQRCLRNTPRGLSRAHGAAGGGRLLRLPIAWKRDSGAATGAATVQERSLSRSRAGRLLVVAGVSSGPVETAYQRSSGASGLRRVPGPLLRFVHLTSERTVDRVRQDSSFAENTRVSRRAPACRPCDGEVGTERDARSRVNAALSSSGTGISRTHDIAVIPGGDEPRVLMTIAASLQPGYCRDDSCGPT